MQGGGGCPSVAPPQTRQCPHAAGHPLIQQYVNQQSMIGENTRLHLQEVTSHSNQTHTTVQLFPGEVVWVDPSCRGRAIPIKHCWLRIRYTATEPTAADERGTLTPAVISKVKKEGWYGTGGGSQPVGGSPKLQIKLSCPATNPSETVARPGKDRQVCANNRLCATCGRLEGHEGWWLMQACKQHNRLHTLHRCDSAFQCTIRHNATTTTSAASRHPGRQISSKHHPQCALRSARKSLAMQPAKRECGLT